MPVTTKPVCAEVFNLRSGGRIEGKVVRRGDRGEYLVELQDGARVSLTRRQIDRVLEADDVDVQYTKRSRALPDTVEAHHELAAWCKKNRRSKLAREHFKRILELDPSDDAARQALGYQLHQGRWLTRDEMMAARGMRKYDGDYRTPQDIALRESTKRREKRENDWFLKIRTWVGWLDGRRAGEGAQLISQVNDPHAAVGLVKILDDQRNPRIRDLLIGTLAELPTPLTVTTLVDYSLNDPDPEVRLQCIDYLLKYHQPINLEPYVQALNDGKYSNDIINRSAVALGMIGDPAAISPLIDALVTVHSFKNVNAPIGNVSAGLSSAPGSGGGGLSMGGNKNPTVRKAVNNAKVREALIELTGGQDFEFDERTWRRWFVKQQISGVVDARRDQ